MVKKVLFVYDAKVLFDNNNNLYTNGTITEKNWKERYCTLGEVSFVSFLSNTTVDSVNAKEKYSLIPHYVRFVKVNQLTNSIKNFISLKNRLENKKTIKEEVINSDLVIARTPSNNAYSAIHYAKKFNKELIVESVGCSFESLWNHSLKGKLFSLICLIKQKHYTKISDNVIYVTNNFLQKRYPTNGKSIGCSDVELPHVNEEVIKMRKKRIENINDKSKIIIGTCGAIDVKYKGHAHVIKALSILKEIGKTNFEYQIVGAGNPKNILKVAKKLDVISQVKILGPINHENVFDWLTNIDIYIQPSDTEGLCRSLIEAMSFGLPCIASNVGGNPELIDAKYLFKKRDFRSLSDLIVKYNKIEMLTQSNINYQKSKEYSITNLNKKRQEFFDSILK